MAEETPSEAKNPAPADLPPTQMIYYEYEGNFCLECNARVLAVEKNADKVDICLDQTVLHAQGGGQPTDTGRLVVVNNSNKNNDRVLTVTKVGIQRDTGVATHTCPNDKDTTIAVGDEVHVQVDADHRRLLSECHTAGHVVDSAMAKCGQFLKPSKGYHFLDGPYVEYQGTIPPEQRPAVLKELQEAFGQLVEENMDTTIELMSREQADEVCNRQAQNFDMDVFQDPRSNNIRVVTVAGYSCPCGGTHVARTGDLKSRQWGITGLKAKKGVVRVKYGQNATKS